VAYSPDGQRLARFGGEAVKVWDAQTGQELLTLKGLTGRGRYVAYSLDGRRLARSGMSNTVQVWDARTGQEILSLKAHAGPIEGLAFSPDGIRLASGWWDKMVQVWEAQSGQAILSCKGHTDPVLGVAFSPDGKRLASGGYEGSLTSATGSASAGLDRSTRRASGTQILALITRQCHPASRVSPGRDGNDVGRIDNVAEGLDCSREMNHVCAYAQGSYQQEESRAH
jgi:WD40 repeat protein